MLIRISTSKSFKDQIEAKIKTWSEKCELLEENDEECSFEAIIEPSKFREITTFLQANFTNTAPEIVEQNIINKTVKKKFF